MADKLDTSPPALIPTLGSQSVHTGHTRMSNVLLPFCCGAGAKLLVAFGSSAAPTFQSLDVPDPESVAAGQPATVILRSAAGSVLLPSTPEAAAAGAPGGIGLPNGTVGSEKAAGKQKKQLVHRAEDITILGPENGGAPPLLRTAGVAAAADAAAGKRRRQPDAAAEEEEEELEQQGRRGLVDVDGWQCCHPNAAGIRHHPQS
jgi:hypothetical protein